uniref:Uncharacterized protein n=1 Tax=Ixodes ricinus TaxID=34613 RepID=A0A6B0UPK2_IXORI
MHVYCGPRVLVVGHGQLLLQLRFHLLLFGSWHFLRGRIWVEQFPFSFLGGRQDGDGGVLFFLFVVVVLELPFLPQLKLSLLVLWLEPLVLDEDLSFQLVGSGQGDAWLQRIRWQWFSEKQVTKDF